MKVAIIGSAHPLRGGLAAFNERLAEELQRQGHDVTIFSFSLQYPSILFPGKSQFTDEPAPKNLKIRSTINSVNPLSWIRTGSMMRKEKFDLIIVKFWLPFMGPAFGTILRRAKKTNNTRVICIVDNIIPHEKRPGDKPFTKYFIKPVDNFITMSREVLDDLKTFTDKPAVFIPHPVYDNYGTGVSKEEACAKLGLDPSKKYLLFFGFIRKYKGLDLLLEAMHDERIRNSDIRLIVAGEFYEDRVVYDEIIKKYDLQNLDLFTDFIPTAEVKYFFSAADLVVQPYKTATQSGITQIAYNFEKPMIVTDVGGLAEVVPDGKVGYVVAPEPASIVDGIIRFFKNEIPGLKENILEEKRKNSWENFSKRMLSE